MLRSGSWQSNVAAHHSNQPTVLPSVSSCKPTSKSSSGPPPLSWTMWHLVSHAECSLLHRWTFMPSDPPFLLPQETDTEPTPEPTPAELNWGETPKAGLDHRHRLSARPLGTISNPMEPCKVPIISPLYREGRIRAV